MGRDLSRSFFIETKGKRWRNGYISKKRERKKKSERKKGREIERRIVRTEAFRALGHKGNMPLMNTK